MNIGWLVGALNAVTTSHHGTGRGLLCGSLVVEQAADKDSRPLAPWVGPAPNTVAVAVLPASMARFGWLRTMGVGQKESLVEAGPLWQRLEE